MSKTHSNYLPWILLFFLSLVWGSSFILIKKALISFSPEIVAGLRIFLSFLFFIPVLIVRRKRINWKLFKYYFIIGLFGNGLPAYLFPLAETHVSSSVTGVLNGLTPIFAVIIGVIFFRQKFIQRQYLGILLGLCGAAILMLYGEGNNVYQNFQYGIYAILATVCYGLSVNTVNAFLKDLDTIMISAMAFLVIGPIAFGYIGFSDFTRIMNTDPDAWYSFGAVLLLALFGTSIATVLFFKLVQLSGVLFSSSVAFIIPIVAMLWGVLDGELMTIFHLFGTLAIISSIYLIRK